MVKLPTVFGGKAGTAIAKVAIARPELVVGALGIVCLTKVVMKALDTGYGIKIRVNQWQGVDFSPQ